MKKRIFTVLTVGMTVFSSSSLFSQENEKLIKDYISQNKIREYKKSDLNNFIVDNVDHSASLNGDVLKMHQTYNNIPVYGVAATALIKDNKVIYFTDNFVKNYNQASSKNLKINQNVAFEKAASDVGVNASEYKIIDFNSADPENGYFVKQRLVYYKYRENMALAYEFMFSEKQGPNYWNILVDANTGEILSKVNLNLSCSLSKDTYSRDHSHEIVTVENKNETPTKKIINNLLLLPDNATYNVFALPLEAPSFGNRSLVTNPWDIAASPEGWHSDGTNHYTITRGNNVFAYTDLNATNTVGASAEGGASRNFDFPLDINQPFPTYQNAALTNLFYMNNKIHDIFYKFGFNETARNFQINNFGNGGAANDAVNAEARDGGNLLDNDHLNNANFATPMDGSKPRMQMFLWDPKVVNRLFYNSPATFIPRAPNTKAAVFGPALTAVGITGDLALSPTNACAAVPAGSLTGKIAVVTAAGCNFTVKTKNLQNAGAIGVIQYHPSSNTPIALGGTDATITIPTIMIGLDEGQFLVNEITNGTVANATLKDDKSTYIYIDGDLDNGVITHEYGHGISNRNTGNGYTCLNASQDNEQMGEGWSDFFALMLTNQPGDNASVPRGMGTFANGQNTNGAGMRLAKYSPNFSINDFTYGDTNGRTLVNSAGQTVPHSHSIGFIWATMLWDLHWQYVAKYGYSSDVTANTTSGSARVLQLVMDGLKLQGCNPSFIVGRDAILAADQVTTGGADKCMIWNTFAKRGLGVNASSGAITPANSTAAAVTAALSDQVEDFTVPAECLLATNETKDIKNNTISIYPNPAKNEFFINFPGNTLGKVSVEIYDMSGKLVSSENKVSPDAKKSISTDKLTNGTYMIKVKGLNIDTTSKVIVKK